MSKSIKNKVLAFGKKLKKYCCNSNIVFLVGHYKLCNSNVEHTFVFYKKTFHFICSVLMSQSLFSTSRSLVCHPFILQINNCLNLFPSLFIHPLILSHFSVSPLFPCSFSQSRCRTFRCAELRAQRSTLRGRIVLAAQAQSPLPRIPPYHRSDPGELSCSPSAGATGSCNTAVSTKTGLLTLTLSLSLSDSPVYSVGISLSLLTKT